MPKTSQKRRYILTGTPGSGKTTIINALSDLGHHVIPESATDIISIQQSHNNPQPWKHPNFIKKIVSLQKKRQIEAMDSLKVIEFYDRSPICTYALALYLDFAPSTRLMQEIERIQQNQIYNNQVFFIENLGFIKKTDARKISFEEALEFEQIHFSVYKQFGYECVMVPADSLKKRVDFILNSICLTREAL